MFLSSEFISLLFLSSLSLVFPGASRVRLNCCYVCVLTGGRGIVLSASL